jgi:hypothetical protein
VPGGAREGSRSLRAALGWRRVQRCRHAAGKRGSTGASDAGGALLPPQSYPLGAARLSPLGTHRGRCTLLPLPLPLQGDVIEPSRAHVGHTAFRPGGRSGSGGRDRFHISQRVAVPAVRCGANRLSRKSSCWAGTRERCCFYGTSGYWRHVGWLRGLPAPLSYPAPRFAPRAAVRCSSLQLPNAAVSPAAAAAASLSGLTAAANVITDLTNCTKQSV